MRKLLNKPWFVVVLALSAVVLCTWSIRDQVRGGRPRAHRSSVEVTPDAAPAGLADETSDAPTASDPAADTPPLPIPQVLNTIVYPKDIPDPFARRATTVVAGEPDSEAESAVPDEKETVELSAVWSQGSVQLAVVNNRILQAGETIGRMTIDQIGLDGIWVTHWKGRNFVPFAGTFTLTTPGGGAPGPSLALHEN